MPLFEITIQQVRNWTVTIDAEDAQEAERLSWDDFDEDDAPNYEGDPIAVAVRRLPDDAFTAKED